MRDTVKSMLITAAAGSAIAGTAVVGSVAAIAAAAVVIRALRSRPVPEGAVVLVTGGSRGLGFALASRFAAQPVRLVLVARDAAELEQAQTTLLGRYTHLRPSDFYLIAADLLAPEECRRVISETIARFGRIDVLINNAGIIEVGPVEAQSLDAFERAIKLHYLAPLYIIWAALPYLRTQTPAAGWTRRAAIVNISSVGGKFAMPHLLPYVASKFALVGFSEGLHAELRQKGIRVTTVCPGLMRSGGEEHAKFAGQTKKEERWFKLSAKTPGLSASMKHAAEKIYAAVASGSAEITITPQAWLIARIVGIAPDLTQIAASLANEYILPAAEKRGVNSPAVVPSPS